MSVERLPLDPDSSEHALWEQARAALNGGQEEQAIELFTRLADHGDWRASLSLGYIYEARGRSNVTEYVRAAHWYSRTLTQADRPEAHLGLARYYYFGLGESNDFERAFEHVRQCDLGTNPQAALMIAEMYFVGAGAERDLAAARLLFTDLANAGYPAGFLGLMRLDKAEGYRLRSLAAFFKGLFLAAKLAAHDKDDERLVGIGGRRGNFRADAFLSHTNVQELGGER